MRIICSTPESLSEDAMTPAQFDLARSGLHAPALQVQFVDYWNISSV